MVLAMTLTLLPKPLVHRAWWRMSLILKANPLQEDMLENLLEVEKQPTRRLCPGTGDRDNGSIVQHSIVA